MNFLAIYENINLLICEVFGLLRNFSVVELLSNASFCFSVNCGVFFNVYFLIFRCLNTIELKCK